MRISDLPTTAAVVLVVPLLMSVSLAPTARQLEVRRVESVRTNTSDVPQVVLEAARELASTIRVDQPVEWVETTTSTYYFGSREAAAARALPDVPVYAVQVRGAFKVGPRRTPMGDALPQIPVSSLSTLVPIGPMEDFRYGGTSGHVPKDLTSMGEVHTFTLS